ncbi:MAG: chitobiase/beta-hexosaminidase C-terminal domain-containing protein [Verrucomicrobiae bacterium]|nr:chitobiase/beta-hexosaminidase C-terminal domain-containing protein [Verrucomicrobiae bacterium]
MRSINLLLLVVLLPLSVPAQFQPELETVTVNANTGSLRFPESFFVINSNRIWQVLGRTNLPPSDTPIIVSVIGDLPAVPIPPQARLAVVLADTGGDRSAGLWIFNPSSSAAASAGVVVPAGNPALGRWLQISAKSDPPLPITYPPTLTPGPGTYAGTQSVTITSLTPGATIYYTLNGTTPTTNSTVYGGALSVATTTTIQAVAWAPNHQVSSVAGGTYTITVPIAATPVLNPPPGNYVGTQSVAITSATPGATIYYTLNGTTPTTNSTVYTGAISVTSTTNLQAVAWAPGHQVSGVAGGTYTITAPTGIVYWGNSSATTMSAAQVQALSNSSAESTPFRQYSFSSGSGVYKHLVWPTSLGSPRAGDGFLLPPFPVAMATATEGATSGPENGWYWQTVTIGGVSYRHYWTFNQLNGAITITVQ